MNFNQIKEDHLNILREIHKKKSLSQRQLAKETGVSLGKLNYCLKALKEKGYIVARRTVAKYREQLEIPVARMRKEL